MAAAVLVGNYLDPLSRVPELKSRVLTSTSVVSVTRAGADKVMHDRDKKGFLVRLRNGSTEHDIEASAVLDASGTWRQPNPAGGNGVPAVGEHALRDMLIYGIPDVRPDPARFAGRTTAVVGGGHSAANAVLALAAFRRDDADTMLHWVVRGATPRAFGGGSADELPARGALGAGARGAVGAGAAQLHTGFSVVSISQAPDGRGLVLRAADGRVIDGLDEIVVATGQRPDMSMTSELRLDLDLALESARDLAPLIDPNVHSCGTVRPHGYLQLAHPEAGFFTVGAKSYGRAPTFLMATGYEQVRSVSAHLSGDEKRARRVSLVLPQTGVCGSSAGSGCCDARPVSAELAGATSAEGCG